MVLVGDMFQIDPVFGLSLHLDALYYDPPLSGSQLPRAIGTRLFRLFKRVTLMQQVRCTGEHGEINQRLRNPEVDNPIDDSIIRYLTDRILSSKDIEDDPSWLEALIVVSHNAQREGLTFGCVYRFAERHGVPITVWRVPAGNRAPRSSTSHLPKFPTWQEVQEAGPSLYSCFVSGAPAICLDNISASVGLANGATCTMHSLSFSEDLENSNPGWSADCTARVKRAGSGELIFIGDNVPKYINVRLPPREAVPGENVITLSKVYFFCVALYHHLTLSSGRFNSTSRASTLW